MGCGQAAVAILDLVQVLDQQIAAPRLIAEQRQDLLASLRIDVTAFRRRSNPVALAASMA